jgi:hypothetical protein
MSIYRSRRTEEREAVARAAQAFGKCFQTSAQAHRGKALQSGASPSGAYIIGASK